MTIIEARDWKLPEHMIQDYAYMMYHSKKNLSGSYSPPLSFFYDMLNRLLNEGIKDNAINIICYESSQPIGWGHASYNHDPLTSEIYIYVVKEHRKQGFGKAMFQYLLERLPSDLKAITVPTIGESRHFLERNYNSENLSKEDRGVLHINHIDMMPNQKYLILENKTIRNHPDIIKQIIALGKMKITAEEMIERINRREQILCAKNIYVLYVKNKEVIAYCHLIHNFEENEQLGFIEGTFFKNEYSIDIDLDMKYALIQYLKSNTRVKSLWTFNDIDSEINKELGFKYLNTNYIYKVNFS